MSKSKAKQALAFAQERAAAAQTWIELHNAMFGIGGKCTELFPTESERTGFCQTPEFAEIMKLIDTRRAETGGAAELADRLSKANGSVSVRMPRSIHAALLAEADAEGVSLNQLCVAKLAVQLRAVV